jgi:hypothetical protein
MVRRIPCPFVLCWAALACKPPAAAGTGDPQTPAPPAPHPAVSASSAPPVTPARAAELARLSACAATYSSYVGLSPQGEPLWAPSISGGPTNIPPQFCATACVDFPRCASVGALDGEPCTHPDGDGTPCALFGNPQACPVPGYACPHGGNAVLLHCTRFHPVPYPKGCPITLPDFSVGPAGPPP